MDKIEILILASIFFTGVGILKGLDLLIDYIRSKFKRKDHDK